MRVRAQNQQDSKGGPFVARRDYLIDMAVKLSDRTWKRERADYLIDKISQKCETKNGRKV